MPSVGISCTHNQLLANVHLQCIQLKLIGKNLSQLKNSKISDFTKIILRSLNAQNLIVVNELLMRLETIDRLFYCLRLLAERDKD